VYFRVSNCRTALTLTFNRRRDCIDLDYVPTVTSLPDIK
jgi:hypothetical protein